MARGHACDVCSRRPRRARFFRDLAGRAGPVAPAGLLGDLAPVRQRIDALVRSLPPLLQRVVRRVACARRHRRQRAGRLCATGPVRIDLVAHRAPCRPASTRPAARGKSAPAPRRRRVCVSACGRSTARGPRLRRGACPTASTWNASRRRRRARRERCAPRLAAGGPCACWSAASRHARTRAAAAGLRAAAATTRPAARAAGGGRRRQPAGPQRRTRRFAALGRRGLRVGPGSPCAHRPVARCRLPALIARRRRAGDAVAARRFRPGGAGGAGLRHAGVVSRPPFTEHFAAASVAWGDPLQRLDRRRAARAAYCAAAIDHPPVCRPLATRASARAWRRALHDAHLPP